jgi:hypothetical protein
MPALDKSDVTALTNFQADFHRNIAQYAQKVLSEVESIRAIYPSKKDFVLNYMKPKTKSGEISKMDESLYTKAHDTGKVENLIDSIMWSINLHMHSGPRFETVRHYIGNISWYEYRKPLVDDSFVGRLKAWAKKKMDQLRMFFLVK